MIWGAFTDDCAAALAASPHLGSVTNLSLSSHSLTDAGAMALVESKALAGVGRLVPHGTRGLSARVRRLLRKRFELVE